MTKVEQGLEKQTKTSPMAYLTAQLKDPLTVSLEKVVERLNKQPGVKPYRAAKFNYNIAVNVYYGKYGDHNNYVETELTAMVAEETGKTAQAKPHLDALRRIMQLA